MIRTRMQGDTPFFPNMLNNGKVEVCLKEDVDKALAEKDKEIAVLLGKLNELRTVFKGWRSYKDDPPKANGTDDFIFCGHQRYAFQSEAETEYFVDVGYLDMDGTLCMFNDWHEGQEIFEIDCWFPLPKHPNKKE